MSTRRRRSLQGSENQGEKWRVIQEGRADTRPLTSTPFEIVPAVARALPEPSRRFAGDPGRSRQCLVFKPQTESGRKDSNLRLPGPKPGALTRLSYAPSPGPERPARKVYPKSTGNQSAVGFQALPTPSPRVPHRQRILGVDSMEVEKEGVDVELRRPVGIGGDLWRLPGLRLSPFRSTPLAQPVIWRRSR